MQKEDNSNDKNKITKVELNFQDNPQNSDNNQSDHTLLSFQRNEKKKNTSKSQKAPSLEQRPASSKTAQQSQFKRDEKRHNTSKLPAAFEPNKSKIQEFLPSNFSQLPRMQQIVEHNKQMEIEKMYQGARKKNRDIEYNSKKPSKLNNIIHNQFHNVEFVDKNNGTFTIYTINQSNQSNQNDNFFTTNKN